MLESKFRIKFKPQNSNLKIWGLLVFCLLFIVFPKLTFAKTLKFNDQTWDVNPSFTGFTTSPTVTANSDLLAVSKNSLLGTPILNSERLLSDETVGQLEEIAKTLDQEPADAKMVIQDNRATE